MVRSESSSSSESESVSSNIGDKELLKFYQNKFDEFQKEDKYKEKVDKHLKELIADRYELEAEVIRKGEKISDLQKALVDLQLSLFEERERFLTVSAENEQLKKNEDILHLNIRQLLSITKDQDLKDRIIYILQDPRVDISYRHVEGKSAGNSTSTLSKKKSTSDYLREEIQQLQSKIDEFNKISKNNSDVILEDCKIALEKSKEKILEDEQEIRKLNKKLQEAEVCGLKHNQTSFQRYEKNNPFCSPSKCEKYNSLEQNRTDSHNLRSTEPSRINENSKSAEQLQRTKISAPSTSKSDDIIYKRSSQPVTISSNIQDLKFSLSSLTQISSKLESHLKNIQSTQAFLLAAKKPISNSTAQCVSATDVVELQNFVRQCTRLSYDLSSMWISVSKKITEYAMPVKQRDMNQLDAAVDDLALLTAEIEILNLSLARAKFFDYLIKPTQPFSKFGVKDTSHSKYVADVVTLENKVKSATISIKTATEIIERIDRKIELHDSHQTQSRTLSNTLSGDEHIKPFPQSNKDVTQKFQSDSVQNLIDGMSGLSGVRRTRSEPIGGGEVTRRIEKTLSKIRQIESGENVKDDKLLRSLAEQIKILSDRLKSLYEEFNMKNLQNQFSEYSSVTLNKLEALSRQSRDTVLSAEAQITAYRSNGQVLSQKLRDTEELLRESIGECLSLKHKLKQLELSTGVDKQKEIDDATQTFLRTKSLKENNRPNTSSGVRQTFLKTVPFDDHETVAKNICSSKHSTYPKRPEGPFECMFCKQGSDHKLCEEKIRELRANIRKLSVELKTLNKEVKDEKKIAQLSKEESERIVLDSLSEKETAKETIQSLETKNASLMDQLKVFKNRLKNMERYRRCEIEGFQTDIKNLKEKIKDLEKQLARAVLIFEHDQKDLELLKTVQATAQRSKTVVSSIKRLKAKLYEIETDIKRL